MAYQDEHGERRRVVVETPNERREVVHSEQVRHQHVEHVVHQHLVAADADPGAAIREVQRADRLLIRLCHFCVTYSASNCCASER